MKFIIESRILKGIEFREDEKDVTHITVPDGVVKIMDAVFSENKQIISVILPTTLVSIGSEAFRDSTVEIVVINSKQSLEIGNLAFCQSKLKHIQICCPLHDLTLGDSCFAFCEDLDKIELWGNFISIGERCFECCTSLVSLKFCARSDNVSNTLQIKSYALLHTKIAMLEVTEYRNLIIMPRISVYKKLTLTITNVNSSQFISTDSINKVTIVSVDASESFKNLPVDTNVPLKYVFISSDVLSSAINETKLTGVVCYNDQEFYSSHFMSTEVRQAMLNAVLRGQNFDENKVFIHMISLSKRYKSIEFSNALIDLAIYLQIKGTLASEYKGYLYQLFNACKQLLIQKSFYVDMSLFNRLVQDGIITELDYPLIKKYVDTITTIPALREGLERWYQSGKPLTALREFVSDNISRNFSVYKQALLFYDGNDFEVYVPSSVKTLTSGAFKNNTVVKRVIIPATVTLIEANAFANSAVEELVCYSTSLVIESEAFNHSLLRVVKFADDKGELSLTLGEFAFANCQLQRINLPDSLTVLPKGCFYNCMKLLSIQLPKRLESIEDKCFEHCTNLSKIQFPEFLSRIGKDAFLDCKSLTSVELPELQYCMEAFGNTSIAEIKMPNSLRILSNTVFRVPQECCIVQFNSDIQFLSTVSVDKICIFKCDNKNITMLPNYVFEDCPQSYQHYQHLIKILLALGEDVNINDSQASQIKSMLLDFFVEMPTQNYAKEIAVFFVQFYELGLVLQDKIGLFILETSDPLMETIYQVYPKVQAVIVSLYSNDLFSKEQALLVLDSKGPSNPIADTYDFLEDDSELGLL